jgi:hypothetical protein
MARGRGLVRGKAAALARLVGQLQTERSSLIKQQHCFKYMEHLGDD